MWGMKTQASAEAMDFSPSLARLLPRPSEVPEPGESVLDDPSRGQTLEAFRRIGPLGDLEARGRRRRGMAPPEATHPAGL